MNEEQIKNKLAIELALRLSGKITLHFEKLDFLSKEEFEKIRVLSVQEMGGEDN